MGVDRLVTIIATAINKNTQGQTHRGQYLGDQVLVNGRTYPADLAVDQDIGYGDFVWIVLSEEGVGVVVGS